MPGTKNMVRHTKAEEVIGPRVDVASLNDHVVKLPSKYSCFHPQIRDAQP